MKTISEEGSVNSEVYWNFTSAIRYNESLLVNGTVTSEGMYECPDERWACPGTNANGSVSVTCGCPYTAWALCALEQATSQQQQVRFITCWDEQGLASRKQTNASMEAAASNCSAIVHLNWDSVYACNMDYSGERAELLFAAAHRFMQKWPEFAPVGGHFHVPHVLVGKEQSTIEDMDIQASLTPGMKDVPILNEKLCALDVHTGSCAKTLVI